MKIYTTLPLFILLAIAQLSAQPAPDFTITGTNNQQHILYADYLDQGKTVVLKIMFVACPPCNSIAPDTEVLYQDWGGGSLDVEFFSLSNKSFDSNADVLGYEQNHNLTYPGAGADGGSLVAVAPYENGTYGPFFGTPTFVVIAPDGTVTYDVVGPGNSGTITALDAAIEATGARRPGSQVFYNVSGNIHTETNQNINLVSIALNDQNTPILTGLDGDFGFNDVASGTIVQLEPMKDIDHDNGLSTFDIVTVQKHILRIQQLDSPYKMIAADVNKSKSITTFDLLQMRKLILFIDTVFEQNTSWRFIPDSYTFPNPQDPFSTNFPEGITINSLDQNVTANFTGLKVGDVTGNADPNMLVQSEGRAIDEITLSIHNQHFNAGDKLTIPFKAKDFNDIIAMQFTLQFDQEILDFVALEQSAPSDQINADDLYLGTQHIEKGMLTFSWNDIEGLTLADDESVFSLVFRTKQNNHLSHVIDLNSKLTVAEAYSPAGAVFKVQLQTLPALSILQSLPNLTPNLVGNLTTLHFEVASENEVTAEIINSSGQLIQQFKFGYYTAGVHNSTLNLSDLPNGVYFLQIREAQQISDVIRFIVRH